jgi:hypothetical protein
VGRKEINLKNKTTQRQKTSYLRIYGSFNAVVVCGTHKSDSFKRYLYGFLFIFKMIPT